MDPIHKPGNFTGAGQVTHPSRPMGGGPPKVVNWPGFGAIYLGRGQPVDLDRYHPGSHIKFVTLSVRGNDGALHECIAWAPTDNRFRDGTENLPYRSARFANGADVEDLVCSQGGHQDIMNQLVRDFQEQDAAHGWGCTYATPRTIARHPLRFSGFAVDPLRVEMRAGGITVLPHGCRFAFTSEVNRAQVRAKRWAVPDGYDARTLPDVQARKFMADVSRHVRGRPLPSFAPKGW